MPARRAITAPRQTGQDRGTTDPANRLADAGIGESRTTSSQPIDGRCFDQGVTVAGERAGRLIVGKEEDNVGWC